MEPWVPDGVHSRRCFLAAGALAGGALLAPPWLDALVAAPASACQQTPGIRLVRTGCPGHNCGGRCLLTVHVRDGVIVRIDTDDRPVGDPDAPPLRACVRGRAYRRRQYSKERLTTPLKRVGARGSGTFQPIGWSEALDTMVRQLERVKRAYGNSAMFVPYGTGSYSQTNGRQTAQRLLNLLGGSLGHYNNYSWAAMASATSCMYGTQVTGHQRRDWANARYILMWGWNPSEMRDGTNTEHYLRLARDRGARIVCVDPRQTPSAVALADEWVPIRPGTDTAMLSAMAYVMLTETLFDAEFVRTHCVGFDSTQMPAGHGRAESYREYVLGVRDGVPKTPSWAERICGVPRATIARLAREYATRTPGVLYQGYGLQRRAYGEQAVRAACVLAAITGNVGVPGGWAGGLGLQSPDGGPLWNVFPSGTNPVKTSIPTFRWTDAVERGRQLTAADGVRGADRLDNDIKLIYAVASNILVNQHANINRTTRLLADQRLVEFIAVQDQVLTPSARFADLVLPACSQLETWGVEDGWKYGDEVFLMPKIVDPPGDARSDYRICADIATRLGLGDRYTEGRDERGWVEWSLTRLRESRYPGLPSLPEFETSNAGVFLRPPAQPAVAFADFRADPAAHPLATPSGRIEIFSAALHALGRPAEIPAVPKYIQEWESPFGPEAARFPLQVIGHHSLARTHSTLEGVDWLEEAFPQRVFINPVDAAARGVASGDRVRVFNDRGETRLPCRVTRRIMPGVIAIPQGAWWTPDATNTDTRGSINVLTSERWTPQAFGNAQHTVMAEVRKA
jgi:anaerobic dimethyl sulfoxide reductase subunit A